MNEHEALLLIPSLEDAETDGLRFGAARRQAQLSRLRDAVLARKIRTRVARHAASATARTAAYRATQRNAAAGVGGRAAGGASRAILGGTASVLLAVGAVAVIGRRLWSGDTLEQMGAELNALALGDVDDDARGRTAARNELEANAGLMRHIGQKGSYPALERIQRSLADRYATKEKGKSLILQAKGMEVNGTLEQLIARIRQAWMLAWYGNNGDEAVRRFQYRAGAVRRAHTNG